MVPITGPTENLKEFSAIFLPGCQAKNWNERDQYRCDTLGTEAGMCNNLTSSLVDTGNTWGKTKAFNGLVNWTLEMENTKMAES